MSLYEAYLFREPTISRFGEPLNLHQIEENAAASMYADARCGGASHMAAYALVLQETEPELADLAAAAYRVPACGKPLVPVLARAMTHKELALREAGLLEADLQ